MQSYFLETWGCQMNQHDSERLAGILEYEGLQPAASAEDADLVLLNTCSVREKPVRKLLGRIDILARLKRRPAIGVCGCVAQHEGSALLKRSKAVDFVLGPGQIGRLGEALRSLEQGQRGVFVGFDSPEDYNFGQIFRKAPTRGMVTVIEGCDEYCTYCIVPYTRGHEVSRKASDIISEVRALVSLGLREIELLGQTINSYSCPETSQTLADLLREIVEIEEVERVRFITSHPRHFGDHLIEVLAESAKLSRYLHLPVQSGADRILKKMNRKYTRQYYLDLVDRIRSVNPDINLSTDVIVGFPGESEDDFLQTLSLLEEVQFGQVFAFAFSPRPHTPAANYAGTLPDDVNKDRLHRLFELSDRISRSLNEGLIGQRLSVLIDGPSRKSPKDWQGRAEDNRVVNFPATGRERVGDIVAVEITAATTHSLVGRRPGSTATLPQKQPENTKKSARPAKGF